MVVRAVSGDPIRRARHLENNQRAQRVRPNEKVSSHHRPRERKEMAYFEAVHQQVVPWADSCSDAEPLQRARHELRIGGLAERGAFRQKRKVEIAEILVALRARIPTRVKACVVDGTR